MEHPDDRFWRRVSKGPGCWEWNGSADKHGYGDAGGHPNHPSAGERAHRIAWAMQNGPIPKGMSICHHCDNPRCVRPDHLFLGTRADNVVDAARKGRMKHKLTRQHVAEIRALIARGIPQVTVATMYDVTSTTVSRIARGLARRHCEDVVAPDLPPIATLTATPTPVPDPPKRPPRVPNLYR